MKILILSLLMILIPGFCFGAEAKECLSTNAFLVTKDHPSAGEIRSNCITYRADIDSWESKLDGDLRQFSASKWDVYTDQGGLVVMKDGTIKLIQFEGDWNTVTPNCPYGDAVITQKDQAKVVSEVSCVNWDANKKMWKVVYFGTSTDPEFIDPAKFDVHTMDGKLAIIGNQVKVISTYRAR